MNYRKSIGPRWRPVAAAVLLGIALLAAACGQANDSFGYRGRILETPLLKADFVLTDTSGSPFSFRAETRGYVTLLFFGYMNCPDVCPSHLADIAAVLAENPDIAGSVKVVFVTVDPERDQPKSLRSWLDLFHPDFIGLTGAPAEVDEAGRAALGEMWFPIQKHQTAPGRYTVDHAAFVIAYTRDNLAHIVYPAGPQENYAHDLPILVRNGWEGP